MALKLEHWSSVIHLEKLSMSQMKIGLAFPRYPPTGNVRFTPAYICVSWLSLKVDSLLSDLESIARLLNLQESFKPELAMAALDC